MTAQAHDTFLYKGDEYWLTVVSAVVLWIILMVKSYQGKRVKLPIAGSFAEKHI